jgi:hypothetical protein
MKWFGKDWGAPVCSYSKHVETPVGQLCLYCETPIAAGDAGFVIPFLDYPSPSASFSERPWHRICFAKSILGKQKAAEMEHRIKARHN